MSSSMLVAEVNAQLQVSFDPEVPAGVGIPSGVVIVESAAVKGGTHLKVPFVLVGDGSADAETILTAIQDSLEANDFQLRATAVRLSQ